MESILEIKDKVDIGMEIIETIIVGGFPIIFLVLLIYGMFFIKNENQDKQKVRKSYFDKKQNYPKRKKKIGLLGYVLKFIFQLLL